MFGKLSSSSIEHVWQRDSWAGLRCQWPLQRVCQDSALVLGWVQEHISICNEHQQALTGKVQWQHQTQYPFALLRWSAHKTRPVSNWGSCWGSQARRWSDQDIDAAHTLKQKTHNPWPLSMFPFWKGLWQADECCAELLASTRSEVNKAKQLYDSF